MISNTMYQMDTALLDMLAQISLSNVVVCNDIDVTKQSVNVILA